MWGLLALGLILQNSHAVIIKGSGDPAANTTAPTGALASSGWQFQGLWGGVLGTPIAPQYFIAAQHVGGSVGGKFTINGITYTTTAYWDDTNSDLRIWKVDGVFGAYAPLYTLNDETGKPLVVFGRGTQRGESVVVSQVLTVYTTNLVTLKSLGVTKKEAQKLFPDATFSGSTMTCITSDVVTNTELRGWKNGPGDSVIRWGENQVSYAGTCLVATFDNTGGYNEAYLSGGDSSGAVFIQDAGIWKLAGINYGIDGPFAASTSETPYYGAMMNLTAMYVGGALYPNDSKVRPASFYATRISVRMDWIRSVINQ